MDTRYLASFLEVAHSGSTAAAARRLNLTPTAVAQRIKALELEIGATLLSRAGRSMQLTAAGAALVGPAQELLQRTRDLKAIAAQDTVAGDLRIGCISSALGYLVPGVLATLIDSFEHLRPHLEPAFSDALYRKVLSDEIDVALMVRPAFELPKEFAWRPLRDEPFVVLAHARLASRQAVRALREEPFIRYHRRSYGGLLADCWLLEAGIAPHERFEIDALDAIAALVQGGLGVSLVPQWQPLHAQPGLVQLALPGPGLQRPIGLLWRRNSARQRLIEVFSEVLFNALPEQQSIISGV
ncbi:MULTISPECIES: LysR family transcriptional regulator [unclassified Pseudomonas]|uniref:LysR family transcriptional regulator n=1 Tax=unclassified Pseudomonas TaxID=196821 RepID=UPI000BD84E02|nr:MULTISPECIES: LysR family transcriptional regulator [unclassified Pseudomonas]PVZ13613.1 DNA-binding transcriptional LysR family regulator [Pseudomonas sp. URIL14HWK12:I12]PVZ23919.1 DNA-binding transcriptional LysR family regulator [Pseudomonas sp. URIL14HWK12:I10]PVZ33442.1 DNA-binding transcriptional LysR family regulator [Pseudomonas sp. URIL14HWK12:I11]SNZ11571.1 DNA-binding transcriptional regulator, LysR family [Pseudomonas sp. URIL14HWK12:I9]